MTRTMPASNQPIASTAPMLSISGLNFFYGESHILRNVSMAVLKGQIACLIGRNGVGKTTLLKNIMGLLSPRTGDICLEGQSMMSVSTNRRARRGIGYVPQGREIIPRLTVRENLIIGQEALGDRGKMSQDIPEEIFELFPVLKTMLNRMGGDLSGGQQQQLAIARALMCRPQIVLLDEPTEGIQPSIVQEIENTLSRINREKGITFIVVEQKIEFVRKLAQTFFIMEKGAIVEYGNAAQLTDDLLHQYLAV